MQRADSRRERAVKQGSVASLMNSGNEVRRSIGSRGQATGPPHAVASTQMQCPARLAGLAVRPRRAPERARPRVGRGDPTGVGGVQRRDRTASRARGNEAPETRWGRGGGREVADAAAGGLQGRALGHRHRVQEGPPLGQSRPAGLRHLDRIHQPGRRDLDVERRLEETPLPACSPALLKAQGKPREPADLRGWTLLYGVQWKSSPRQSTRRCEQRPADRKRRSRRGSDQKRKETKAVE